MTRKRHSSAVRAVAAALDRRLSNITRDHHSDLTVKVTEGREPTIHISIKVKS